MIKEINLPLYYDPDFTYNIVLEGGNYNLRFYYNERGKFWCYDLKTSGGEPISLGRRLVVRFPMEYGRESNLTGYFWLDSIGRDENHTINEFYPLKSYYTLRYIYKD